MRSSTHTLSAACQAFNEWHLANSMVIYVAAMSPSNLGVSIGAMLAGAPMPPSPHCRV